MRKIQSADELKSLTGQHVAISDWVEITQDRINLFAEATGDHQWIHTDPGKAKADSPFGTTVAHGFLTLSLIPMLMENAIHLTYIKMGVNYGLNKVRFPAPVPVNSRLRAHLTLRQIDDIQNGQQMHWEVIIECAGSDKPVCVAESIALCYE